MCRNLINISLIGLLTILSIGHTDAQEASGSTTSDQTVILAQVPSESPSDPGGGVQSRAIAGQENLFLRLGSIKGQATTKGFEGQVVLQTMSYAIRQAGAWEEGNRLSGRLTTFSDLTFVKDMDVSSPSLAVACATKEQFPMAAISATTAGAVYLRVTLEGVIVSSVSVGFNLNTMRFNETVTLNYQKATWEWGTAKGGYDLKMNQKI